MAAHEQLPPDVGRLCRERRMQAGVSLHRMAKITHRDASSLSRFERGQVAPRDLSQLVRAYTDLQQPNPLPPDPAKDEAQALRTARKWPLVLLGTSMVGLLTAVALIGYPLGDAQAVRLWVIMCVAALTPQLAANAWDAYQRNPAYALHGAAHLFALHSIALFGLIRWDHTIHPVAMLVAMPAVMLATLAMAFNERRSASERP